MKYWNDGEKVTILNNDERLTLEPISEEIIRVTGKLSNSQGKKYSFVKEEVKKSSFHQWNIEQADYGLLLKTNKIIVIYEKKNGRLSFYDIQGKKLLEERNEVPRKYFTTELNGHILEGAEETFNSWDNEILGGMGQHNDGFINLKGLFIHMTQYNTVIPIPMLVSGYGYGILWDNSSLTEFNPQKEEIPLYFFPDVKNWHGKFVSEEEGEYQVIFEKLNRNMYCEHIQVFFGEEIAVERNTHWYPNFLSGTIYLEKGREYQITVNGTGRLYIRKPEQKRYTTFWSEAGGGLDYYFLYGPKPDEIIKNYRFLTGQVPMLPRWAFGYWQSRERYHTMKELLHVAEKYREKNYPLDVMVQDWQYWRAYGWNAMKFHPDYSEAPSSDIQKIKKLQLHLALSVWPNFGDEPENEVYHLFQEKGYLLDDTAVIKQIGGDNVLLQGVQKNFIDVMDENCLNLYWEIVKEQFLKKGVDVWWLDANEPNLSSLQDTYRQYETATGSAAECLNLYSFMQCRKVYRGQRETGEDKRVCILSRSGYAGQQAFGATVWSGDSYGTWLVLRQQITAGLNLCLAGYPYWGCDIGGLVGNDNMDPEYRELYVRWFQFAAFTPIFRAHGNPGQTGREIWSFGEEVEEILLKYLKIRYQLLPYIYSVSWMVTKTGYTMMRPLIMDFTHDKIAMEITDQYMFGPSLMVCPVLQPHAVSRSVYLPKCKGFYFHNTFYHGGQRIEVDAPLDAIPTFYRAGSIVITGNEDRNVGNSETDVLTVAIYGGEDGKFVLYEDEGDSYHYERGEYAEISFRWVERRKELMIGKRKGTYKGMASVREFRIIYYNVDNSSTEYGKISYIGNTLILKL